MTEQEPQEAAQDRFEGEYASIIEAPAGGIVWKPQMECYVREFTLDQIDRAQELMIGVHGGKTFLNYHVPVVYRGIYRVADLPPAYNAGIEWRTDDRGFVRCTATKMNGDECNALAQHRSSICPHHGGRLHPFDKRATLDEDETFEKNSKTLGKIDPEKLTRWQQLLAGHITVEDLDDEELARGQCRGPTGRFAGVPPKMVPRVLHDQMMKQLLSRAQQKFREGLLGSIDALNEIATGTAYEPADRIKAATIVIDRVMGKTPDVVAFTSESKPWEQIFEGISRNTDGSGAYARLEAAIDAEVVEVEDNLGVQTVHKKEWGPGLQPGQHNNTLAEIPEPTDFGAPNPDHVGPWKSPPNDPHDREAYEIGKLELAVERTEAIKKARSRRFAARAVGSTTIDNLPYTTEVKTICEPTEETEGLYRVKFIAPENTKVPPHLLAKETRRRKYSRE